MSDFAIGQARSLAANEGRQIADETVRVISFAIRDEMILHYFHFMETFLIAFSVHREYFPKAHVDRIIFGAQVWNNPAHADVQSRILETIYPDAKIIDTVDRGLGPIENLVYIDRWLTQTSLNKMMEPLIPLISNWAPELRTLIYDSVGIERLGRERSKLDQRALYVSRQPPRTLTCDLEQELLGLLTSRTTLTIGEFIGMCWIDQVRSAAENDIMVGVHGNGLTNLLWLPPHATVIEIFPRSSHHYDYQMMCEVMGLDYFGLEGDSIFRPFSRHGPSYGSAADVNQPISSLNISGLLLAVSLHIKHFDQMDGIKSEMGNQHRMTSAESGSD